MIIRGYTYEPVSADAIPDGVRFDVPGFFRGQILEYAFGDFGAAENGPGDPYARLTDRSEPHEEPQYFRLVKKA